MNINTPAEAIAWLKTVRHFNCASVISIIDAALTREAALREELSEKTRILNNSNYALCELGEILGVDEDDQSTPAVIESAKLIQQRLTVADHERDHAAALVEVNRDINDELRQRVGELERALSGMLFAFDDGVGRDWSAPLLDFARKVAPAAEFKPASKGDSHDS